MKKDSSVDNPETMHPSGMTWERWRWPFKTEAERKLVMAYNKRVDQQRKRDEFNNLEEAPF